jgi:multidrug efflux pump
MRISDVCISRPVLATVLNILVVLIGVVAFSRLTLREYPNIDVPTVTVATTYPGANAEIMETQVTKVIEDQLSGIEGIDYISSISRPESSQITVVFKLDRDADAAASDVRDRVGRARDALPDEVDEPVIAKVEADAQPIIYLAFSSDRHSELEVTDAADRLVQDRLQTLPGVADAPIFGQRRYAMRIWLDPARLAALQVTVQDVENALRAQNVEIPAGRIESKDREFTVLAETDVNTVEGFERLVIRDASGYLIRLQDVARIEVGPQDERTVARFRGQSAVAIGIVKQSTANPLEVSRAVEGALPTIAQSLPAGMKVDVAYDSTIFIDASIESVYHAIAEAVGLVVLVIFFFLRNLRATLIPIITIPVSLIGAFTLMYIMGFTINTLTLLSFVIAIGLVVDDAIVVLENIYRHIERGLSPVQAAFKGSREIGFAVVSMTVTLAAVFVPVAFTEGKTGKLFTEFALTLASAVLLSGFIALTLSPMMCSRLLRHDQRHGLVYRLIEGLFRAMNRGYRGSLAFVLTIRPVILLFCGLVAFAAWTLFSSLASELSPLEDRGFFIGFILGPEGATVEYMDQYARQIEGIYDTIPEAERHFMVIGFPVVSQAISFVGLKDWSERERKTAEVAGSIGGMMFGVKGVLAFPINPQSLGQEGLAQPIEMVLQTTGSYEELGQVVQAVMVEAMKNPSIVNLDSDLKLNKPEIRVNVNRDKLAAVGVDVSIVGRTLETMLGGRQVTRFKLSGEQYDVIVQLDDVDRRNPDDMAKLYVRGPVGDDGAPGVMIQLSNLVTLTETIAPRELNHFNKLRAATITGNLAPGYTQGEALAYLESVVRQVGGPGIQIDYGGAAREFQSSSASLGLTFLLAIGFVFLVMAAQFESWIDPFVVMFAVPLAMVGALLAITLTGGTLNIFSQIGLISLVGLITKNGILVVEFANQLREKEGMGVREAVVEASVLRLRPILMTAFALILGTFPLAFAAGAGAESRQAIGWVIVGGMTVGTFFTLYVVPTIYSYLARDRHTVKIPSEADLEAEEARQGVKPAGAH